MKEKGSFSETAGLFGALISLAPILAAPLVLETIIRISPKAKVRNFRSLELGSDQDSEFNPDNNEISIPYGGTATVEINGKPFLVKDYKSKGIAARKGALVSFGGKLTEIIARNRRVPFMKGGTEMFAKNGSVRIKVNGAEIAVEHYSDFDK